MSNEYDMLIGLQVANYSSIGALTFTFYDIVLSFQDEVEKIWRRPWTNLKRLYIFLRFVSFTSQIVYQLLYMTLPIITSNHHCQTLVIFQGISSQVLIVAVQFLLILRVKALYRDNIYLQWMLLVMYLIEVSGMSVVLALSIPDILYGPKCVAIYFPPKAAGYLVLTISFEMLLFIMTMIKFYQSLDEGWGHMPFISRFMKDGIWAFALPFIILTINTCFIALNGPFSSVAYSWVTAITGFAGCHLILNMSHLFKRRSDVTNFSREMLDTLSLTSEIRWDIPLDSYEASESWDREVASSILYK